MQHVRIAKKSNSTYRRLNWKQEYAANAFDTTYNINTVKSLSHTQTLDILLTPQLMKLLNPQSFSLLKNK